MGFAAAVQTCFSKYVTWSGRASRSEYWWFFLFIFIGFIVTSIIDTMMGTTFSVRLPDGTVMPTHYGYVYALFALVTFLPNLSVAIRRLHDKNKSGWWFWLVLIPLIGAIILLIWFIGKGTTGSNDYGPDPVPGT